MTTLAQSIPLRRDRRLGRRSRRIRRFALQCESLESRQLLSIGQTGLAAGVLVNPSAANGQVSVPAIVSNYNAPSYQTIEIEFGTYRRAKPDPDCVFRQRARVRADAHIVVWRWRVRGRDSDRNVR